MLSSRPNLYDYLKIIAIITMVIDHIGYYFFPEQIRMRLVGRLAFPIFLFLVGFSNAYKRKWDIFVMAIVIQGAQLIGYHYFAIGTLQLNILWAIIGLRVFLHRYQYHHKYWLLIIVSLMLCILHVYVGSWIDYGMLAWGLGIFGFLVRNNINQKEKSSLTTLGSESNRIYTIYYGIFTMMTILIYNIV